MRYNLGKNCSLVQEAKNFLIWANAARELRRQWANKKGHTVGLTKHTRLSLLWISWVTSPWKTDNFRTHPSPDFPFLCYMQIWNLSSFCINLGKTSKLADFVKANSIFGSYNKLKKVERKDVADDKARASEPDRDKVPNGIVWYTLDMERVWAVGSCKSTKKRGTGSSG